MGTEETTLATLPPTRWAEARRRLAELARYDAIDDPSGDDAHRAADRLGLTTRSFYRLAATYREARRGRARAGSRRGRHSVVDARTDRVVAGVIRDLGRSATDAAVLVEAVARCLREDVPAPSMTAVRTRTGAGHVTVDLRRRLDREGDLMLDACGLDLDVLVTDPSGRDAAVGAVLVTLHRARDGRLLAHALHAGPPSTADLVRVVAAGSPDRSAAEAVGTASLVATSPARETLGVVAMDLETAGIRLDPAAGILRAGAIAVPVLGRRLGRIALSPRRSQPGTPELAVPIGVARAVVDDILRALPGPSEHDAAGRPPPPYASGARLSALADAIDHRRAG